jgi:hypothetical protein
MQFCDVSTDGSTETETMDTDKLFEIIWQAWHFREHIRDLDYRLQAVLNIFFASLDQFTACKNMSHWMKAA